MSVNIARPRARCRRDCERGGPGRAGHVRRCEHGRIWRWRYSGPKGLLHLWEPLPRWRFITYWRAVRALVKP